MERSNVIEVKGLSKKYGPRTVLDYLEFDIRKGEIFGLLGPNGAGKSTFLSVLTTLVRPTSGDVWVNSASAARQPGKVRRYIGYVPQDIALYPTLSGLDNLNFWAGIYGLTGIEKKGRIREALEVVQLEDRARDRVSEYSGGMKRRMNIAAALLHRPEILVMDEPTVGVDVKSRKLITGAVRKLKEEGRTVVFTSHYIDEMESLCDRIAIIHEGRIPSMGTVEELQALYSGKGLEDILLNLY